MTGRIEETASTVAARRAAIQLSIGRSSSITAWFRVRYFWSVAHFVAAATCLLPTLWRHALLRNKLPLSGHLLWPHVTRRGALCITRRVALRIARRIAITLTVVIDAWQLRQAVVSRGLGKCPFTEENQR